MVEKKGSEPTKMKNIESSDPASSSFCIFIKIFCLWSKYSSKMGIV